MARLREMEAAGRLTHSIPVLADSYVHMHLNRLFASRPRMHELVVYDFLAQLYAERAARARHQAEKPSAQRPE